MNFLKISDAWHYVFETISINKLYLLITLINEPSLKASFAVSVWLVCQQLETWTELSLSPLIFCFCSGMLSLCRRETNCPHMGFFSLLIKLTMPPLLAQAGSMPLITPTPAPRGFLTPTRLVEVDSVSVSCSLHVSFHLWNSACSSDVLEWFSLLSRVAAALHFPHSTKHQVSQHLTWHSARIMYDRWEESTPQPSGCYHRGRWSLEKRSYSSPDREQMKFMHKEGDCVSSAPRLPLQLCEELQGDPSAEAQRLIRFTAVRMSSNRRLPVLKYPDVAYW